MMIRRLVTTNDCSVYSARRRQLRRMMVSVVEQQQQQHPVSIVNHFVWKDGTTGGILRCTNDTFRRHSHHNCYTTGSSCSSSSSSIRRNITTSTNNTIATTAKSTDVATHRQCHHQAESINHLRRYQHQQIRWKGRNDGNRYAASGDGRSNGGVRKTTKKKRKEYRRQLRKQDLKHSVHSPPGSKAVLKRAHQQREEAELLQNDHEVQDPATILEQRRKQKYDSGDALLDDLMGNTSMVTPTPEPTYIGHLHRFYYNQVVDQMDDYHHHTTTTTAAAAAAAADNQLLLLQQQPLLDSTTNTSTTDTATTPMVSTNHGAELPSDEMISKALRAYRDKNGNRTSNPIGIVKGLQHLLYDMQIPVSAMGEYTYTTLLTCCRTPSEGRRIMQMIREQALPISAYSYSILCHLYAKIGDYDGCVKVQHEMLEDRVSPTLPSYTSLLAACYKVCNNGRISHPERAKAAKVGWEKWQEMRIIGIEADAMAYGAILRLKASSGKAEQCINLLNEMPRFNVHPTTLCFTTALRAVARSHAIAIRYEKGISPRNRRREMITTHHGKLARQIVIMAEGANIVKDDGFISALCLCAGEAGDVATVKAIFLANEILRTQQDHLRRIGSNEHLARLRGVYNDPTVNDPHHNTYNTMQLEGQSSATSSSSISMIEQPKRMVQTIMGGESEEMMYTEYDEPIIGQERRFNYNDNGESSIMTNGSVGTSPSSHISNNGTESRQRNSQRYIPTYGEREYGKDSRVLSSVIHACAQAASPNMMGSIWQGRENNGFLCINSLRLISQPKLPQYTDTSIPGQTITDNLKAVREDRDGYREGKRQSRKFEGVDIDENVASTMDEVLEDNDLARRYINSDGRRKFEYRSFTPEEVWRKKYGDDWQKDDTETSTKAMLTAAATVNAIDNTSIEQAVYLESFDKAAATDDDSNNDGLESFTKSSEATEGMKSSTPESANPVGDIYFDYETMRWKPKSEKEAITKSVASNDGESAENRTKHEEVKSVVDELQTSKTVEEEMYFDTDIMRWKTRPKVQIVSTTIVSPVAVAAADQEKSEGGKQVNTKRQGKIESDDESTSDDSDEDGWESSDDSDEEEDFVFDKKKQQWVLKSQPVDHSDETPTSTDIVSEEVDENFETELYYDETEQEWKTKHSKSSDVANKVELVDLKLDKPEPVKVMAATPEKEVAIKEVVAETIIPVDQEAENEKAFLAFYDDLRKESFESEQDDVTEEEARDLFVMMKDEYNEMIVMTPEELGLENHPHVVEQKTKSPSIDEPTASNIVQEVDQSLIKTERVSGEELPLPTGTIKLDSSDLNTCIPINEDSVDASQPIIYQQADTTIERYWSDAGSGATLSSYGATTQTITIDQSYDNYNDADESNTITAEVIAHDNFANHEIHSLATPHSNEPSLDAGMFGSAAKQMFEMFETKETQEDSRLVRLRQLLPNFSDRRLVKIIRCYQASLGDPSLLELVPIVRENMPDYITSTWLKQQATSTATFAIQKAAQSQVVNTEILNSVLELQTSCGSLDKAIEFHQTEFSNHDLEPTEYSDRLVLQMLLRNGRFNRALSFKQTVEGSDRSLDIKSYGSLVEYCARRKQLGSAILLLKECLSIHRAPPGESSLSDLRLLCRQARVEDEIGLESMIGKDPLEWLRHGERELKREYSKKGRRDVRLARNALVRL